MCLPRPFRHAGDTKATTATTKRQQPTNEQGTGALQRCIPRAGPSMQACSRARLHGQQDSSATPHNRVQGRPRQEVKNSAVPTSWPESSPQHTHCLLHLVMKSKDSGGFLKPEWCQSPPILHTFPSNPPPPPLGARCAAGAHNHHIIHALGRAPVIHRSAASKAALHLLQEKEKHVTATGFDDCLGLLLAQAGHA